MEPNTIPAQVCSMMQREPDHSGTCPHLYSFPKKAPSPKLHSKESENLEGGAHAAWLALGV